MFRHDMLFAGLAASAAFMTLKICDVAGGGNLAADPK